MIDLDDTLTEATRTRATLEHDTRDIAEKLEDIRWWYPQLADTMLAIGSQAMDLTGIRGTTQRIPGGDSLAMLGPYSVGYDEPDDLPHPAQIVREWADRWREATRTPTKPGEKWASHLAILQANVTWYIRMDQSEAFRNDIRALWGRLRALTGNQEREEREHRGAEDCRARAHEIPDDQLLTRDQAEVFFPGIRNRIDVDRSRERDRARKEKRPVAYRCDMDERGRFTVSDLRQHYGANTPNTPLLVPTGTNGNLM